MLTFIEGDDLETIDVLIDDDDIPEEDEQFTITLTAVGDSLVEGNATSSFICLFVHS